MTKYAIFCDGTWMSLRDPQPTNVVLLARSLASVSAKGVPQAVYYDAGIGIGSNVSPLNNFAVKYLGGMFGSGLDEKIERAYQFLVLNFEPGDEIYVFGFSRGAYTARSLCGLIRKCGILKRNCFNQIPEAMRRYRSKANPGSPEMIEFRKQYTHSLAAGPEDYIHFGIDPPAPCSFDRAHETREDLYQYRPDRSYRMMFAGIWDTVGELGVPRRIDLFGGNRRYDFHDTQASSLMSSLRHAVAANEGREVYDVTPFANLDTLNNKWAAITGWDTVDPAARGHVPYAYRPYQERWFPGDHCSVGGGTPVTGLSSAALLWIAEGANWAGLDFIDDPNGPLAEAARAVNPLAPLGDKGTTTWPHGDNRRDGPIAADQISRQARLRYLRMPGYRPPNLSQLALGGGREQSPPPGFPRA